MAIAKKINKGNFKPGEDNDRFPVYSKQFNELVDSVNSFNSAPYKKYTALLTQTGTNAPVATVLENTLGGEVVWSYDGVGEYLGTLAGAFPQDKTIRIIGSPTGGIGAQVNCLWTGSADIIYIESLDITASPTNGELSDTTLEIRVYE